MRAILSSRAGLARAAHIRCSCMDRLDRIVCAVQLPTHGACPESRARRIATWRGGGDSALRHARARAYNGRSRGWDGARDACHDLEAAIGAKRRAKGIATM